MSLVVLLDPRNGLVYEKVGSRVTSSVFDPDADHDYLVYEEDFMWLDDLLKREGYTTSKTWYQPTENLFTSYRNGDINILVTPNAEFFRKFMLATRLATKFDLTDKQDRIALFQAILYGKEYTSGR